MSGQDALEREDWSTARDNFTKLLQTAGLEEVTPATGTYTMAHYFSSIVSGERDF